MQYYFDGNEHEISCDETRKRWEITFSTRKHEKNIKVERKKKHFIVLSSVGRFENTRTVADIPINYKQVCDVSQQSQSEEELIEILDLCWGQEGTRNAFIRDVWAAPEKSIFLATNTQLADIERFCCSNHCWRVFGIDPTFNICDSNITITTYKHPLLCRTGTNISPVLLGPILIHSNKSYDSFFDPNMSNLKAFRRDGEKNLSYML